MVEKRLCAFAGEAHLTQRGPLDNLANSMRDMPEDLTHIKKERIGRHRVYYTGHHTQCAYRAFYIKCFKRTGVDDDNNRRFHDKLRRALNDPPTRNIESVT
jgi:hypothetical protein